MSFFSPWYLAAAALVSLPVWLHLLEKHRNITLPFSSLMFFERRTQSSVKHRRLRYLLLFALRTAVLLLLALTFADPFLRSSRPSAGGGNRLLVVAIDQSFSMREGSRLERAKTGALRTLAALGSGDRAQVLAFGEQVRWMSEPSSDPAALRAGVQAVEATDTRGSYAELARALRSIAAAARGPLELHLFSDLQKSSLPSSFADLRLPEGVRLIPHAVSEGRAPNFAVENVIAPRRVFDPAKVRLQVTVASYGAPRASRRLALVLNGRELGSKTVEVPAGGRASAEFLGLDAPHGLNRGEIRIDSGDSFPGDDRFRFAVERSDARPALFIHDPRSPRGLLYFRAALESSAGAAFTLESVSAGQSAALPLSKYAFVVLSDPGSLPSRLDEELRAYAQAGGSLLIALGRFSAARGKIAILDEAVIAPARPETPGERFETVAWVDRAHPSIRRAGSWDDVKFYQAVRVKPGKARVAARLSDETPLLFEQQVGQGRVLVFASTFDNIANDFPLHASFVPFIEQTAHYLGNLDDGRSSYLVGSFFELRQASSGSGATVEVLDPSGARALSLEESTRARVLALASAGFYDVRRPSGRHELVAVNPDRQESDLDLIPAETLALWENTGKEPGVDNASGEQESRRVPFWWYLMAALLLLALGESLVSNRHLGKEAG
ncbi:MAG: VWA domain-containing protein [Acidobacteria bacterium]|nr:VWA domain-containing protein [Acidobacteriota bacterium]